jgi:hypothetical protein
MPCGKKLIEINHFPGTILTGAIRSVVRFLSVNPLVNNDNTLVGALGGTLRHLYDSIQICFSN